MATKDSRFAVRLASEQDALALRAAEAEGTDLTNSTVTATLAHAHEVLADRRSFGLARPIDADDGAATFDSGEPSLDHYLNTRALTNYLEGASRCYVTCRDGRVVGYYAPASAAIQRSDAPGRSAYHA